MKSVKSVGIIYESLRKLEEYILKEKYRGYDPYDGLMSPVFKLPVLKSNKFLRLGFQQIFKRLPVNLRSLLGIKKGYNPVTLGLCLQAFTYLSQIFPGKKNFYLREIDFLIEELDRLKSNGYSGVCWGYDFDWEARYAKIPAFTPNIVATGFITNALFENYRITKNDKSFKLCESATKFILSDLNKSFQGETFCWSYSPYDKQIVYNATMKGARLLSQVYSVTGKKNLKLEAKKTVGFVVNYQNDDGSWSYSLGDKREWVDNFHTGYILDCLSEYRDCTGDDIYDISIMSGFEYYLYNFFNAGYIPKYYNNSLYPLDSTAVAQSILTLCRFNKSELAEKILNNAVKNMQAGAGYFYYQKHKYYSNKISYIRWSNAWMFLAISYLLYKTQK